ncbi:unnamed protein product, partial [Acanthoscelides obtectus]
SYVHGSRLLTPCSREVVEKKGKVEVKTSFKGINVAVMNEQSFYSWEDHTSQYKLNKITRRPYLKSVVEVHFTRGEITIQYRESFEGPFITLNFLNHKSFKTGIKMPNSVDVPRGINVERKQTIISRLGSIFPPNRLKFWESQPTVNKEEGAIIEDTD